MKMTLALVAILMALPLVSIAQQQMVDFSLLDIKNIPEQPALHSLDGKPYTGIARQHFDKEQVTLEWHFRDGRLEKQLGWKDSGAKEREFHFRKGQPHGKLVMYYDNGQKYFEETYVDGKLQGTQYGWYSDGSLRLQTEFAHGTEVMRLEWPRPEGVLPLPKKGFGC